MSNATYTVPAFDSHYSVALRFRGGSPGGFDGTDNLATVQSIVDGLAGSGVYAASFVGSQAYQGFTLTRSAGGAVGQQDWQATINQTVTGNWNYVGDATDLPPADGNIERYTPQPGTFVIPYTDAASADRSAELRAFVALLDRTGSSGAGGTTFSLTLADSSPQGLTDGETCSIDFGGGNIFNYTFRATGSGDDITSGQFKFDNNNPTGQGDNYIDIAYTDADNVDRTSFFNGGPSGTMTIRGANGHPVIVGTYGDNGDYGNRHSLSWSYNGSSQTQTDNAATLDDQGGGGSATESALYTAIDTSSLPWTTGDTIQITSQSPDVAIGTWTDGSASTTIQSRRPGRSRTGTRTPASMIGVM